MNGLYLRQEGAFLTELIIRFSNNSASDGSVQILTVHIMLRVRPFNACFYTAAHMMVAQKDSRDIKFS